MIELPPIPIEYHCAPERILKLDSVNRTRLRTTQYRDKLHEVLPVSVYSADPEIDSLRVTVFG